MRHVALAYGTDALRNKWGAGAVWYADSGREGVWRPNRTGDAFAVAKRLLTITNHCEQLLRR